MERRGEFGAVAASRGWGHSPPSRVPAARAFSSSGGGRGLRRNSRGSWFFWEGLDRRAGGRVRRARGAVEPEGASRAPERMTTVILKGNTAGAPVIRFEERSMVTFLSCHGRSEISSLVFHTGKLTLKACRDIQTGD